MTCAMSSLPPKTPQESQEHLRVPAFPHNINALGHVKAGHMLKLIDIAGSMAAKKHLGKEKYVVTASLDRTDFRKPVRAWEFIQIESRLTQVWHTSMEAQVSVTAWNMFTEELKTVATAHLVFVGLDGDRQKLSAEAIPGLTLETDEDRKLAEAADLRKKNREHEGKELPMVAIDPATDAPVVVEEVMMPTDANALDNVFGGVILKLIDDAGRQAAERQALSGTVVGVRQDRMSFLAPAFIGETVRARAIVTNTWRTSMEVQVEVEAIHPGQPDAPRAIAHSYLIYVRLGQEGQPAQVPPFQPQTAAQKQRAEAAQQRREIREQERCELKEQSSS